MSDADDDADDDVRTSRLAFRRRHCRRGRGFTLLEATVSAAVVGVMFVAALGAMGQAAKSRQSQAQRARGVLLAEDLLAEVLQQAYRDPAGGTTFGPESGETTRAAFDDVDDYNGFTASPPKQKDGTTIGGFGPWGRKVTVAFVEPADLTRAVNYETGVKRVTVVATNNGVTVATVTSVIADVSHSPESEGP